MAYGDFKDLSKRPAADKVLHDRAFNIAKNPRYDGYQRGLAWMFFILWKDWEVQLKKKLSEINNQLKNYTN